MLLLSKFSFFGPGGGAYDLYFSKENFRFNSSSSANNFVFERKPLSEQSGARFLLLAQKKGIPESQKIIIKLAGPVSRSLCVNIPSIGFIVSEKGYMYLINRNLFLITLFFFALNLLLGLVKKLKSRLYLVGLRVRVERIYRRALVLKLNLCHKVKWVCTQQLFLKFKKIKNAFIIKSRDPFLHMLFLFLLRRFKLPDVYKGNGIRFYKEKLKFKKRKQFGTF